MTLHAVERTVRNGSRVWQLRDHVHNCSFFPAPHNRATIFAKVLQQVQDFPPWADVSSPEQVLRSITYDAATNNAAFDECVLVEKLVCFGHRLNTLLEHLFKECEPWQSTCDLVLGVGKTVKNSTVNRQEVERVQLGEKEHAVRVVMPVNLPRTRWGDHPMGLRRMQHLRGPITSMDVSNMYFAAPVADSLGRRRSWCPSTWRRSWAR